MKNYLLTWYGITDLRASLGFEKQGPILSALLEKNFTHITILAYTNKNKDIISSDIPAFDTKKLPKKNFIEKFIKFFSKDEDDKLNSKSVFKNLTNNEAYSYVEKISNTPQANKHFKLWLESQLKERGKNIDISLREVSLEKLNDAKGIYTATIDSFNSIKGKKQIDDTVTVFLSPGTPVMAFSWALAAIYNPDMNITLLSSSSLKRNLEKIELPFDLKTISVQKLDMSKPDNFDVIFHLLGEQPLPTVLALNQFKSTNHVFVTSPPYNADNVKKFVPKDANIYTLEVDPYSPADTDSKIRNFMQKQDWQVKGFNLTGGTKLMYEGAMQACKKEAGIPFYFEAKSHTLIWLNSFDSQEIKGIGRIDDFFAARGYKILSEGNWTNEMQKRIKTTEFLWRNRRLVSKYYKDILFQTDKGHDAFASYEVYKKKDFISFDGRDGVIYIKDHIEEVFDAPDFTKYITGGWLEEFAYLQLKPSLNVGTISDMRIGLEISSKNDSLAMQEFDITFTDNKRLFIIECKSGTYTSDAIIKLQNNISTYAGITGKGCIVACFYPYDKTKKVVENRIDIDSRITLLAENDVTSELKNLIKILEDKELKIKKPKVIKEEKLSNKFSENNSQIKELSKLLDS